MSSTEDKSKGMANEVGGKIKQAAGKLLGDDQTHAEGVAQETKGKGQQAVGDAKDAVKSAIDRI